MRTVYLVSCVAKKRGYACAAKDMYVSPWFLKARRYVEGKKCNWWILSAKYELLHPDKVIDPYELSLYQFTKEQRVRWAKNVASQLEDSHYVVLAGRKYTEYLLPHLHSYEVPMRGLGIGKQLAWLGR